MATVHASTVLRDPLHASEVPRDGVAELSQESRERPVQVKAVATAPAQDPICGLDRIYGCRATELDLEVLVRHLFDVCDVQASETFDAGRALRRHAEPRKVAGSVDPAHGCDRRTAI